MFSNEGALTTSPPESPISEVSRMVGTYYDKNDVDVMTASILRDTSSRTLLVGQDSLRLVQCSVRYTVL